MKKKYTCYNCKEKTKRKYVIMLWKAGTSENHRVCSKCLKKMQKEHGF